MKNKNIPRPTEAELEILGILWKNGPSTVRFVNEILNRKRPVGYTTTLKLMQIMREKNILNRNEENRSHLYIPAIKEQETQRALLKNITDKAFGGSAMKLVMQALGNYKASRSEITQIRSILDKIERGEK